MARAKLPSLFDGAVWLADDNAVKLPPHGVRVFHDVRPVVILHAEVLGARLPGDCVFAIPCSGSFDGELGAFDLVLPAGTAPFDARTMVFVSLLQKLRRTDLRRLTGQLSPPAFREVCALARQRLTQPLLWP